MTRVGTVGMTVALGVFLAGAAYGANIYPDLPVAEWNTRDAVSLEDFRGQVTALVFYDDDLS